MKGITFEVLYDAPIPIKITGPDGHEGGNALDKLPTQIWRWAEAAMKEDYGGAYLEIPTDWAKTLSRRSGCDESQIIVTVPPWSIVDHWLKEGQARTHVRQRSSDTLIRKLPGGRNACRSTPRKKQADQRAKRVSGQTLKSFHFSRTTLNNFMSFDQRRVQAG